MDTAVSSLPNTDTGGVAGFEGIPTPGSLTRRAARRRQMLGLVGISYVIDAMILMLYGYGGTIPMAIGPAFAACGLTSIAGFIALSEAGVNDRFKDHYFMMPQACIGVAIILTFMFLAPQAGVLFLCSLFVVFAFGSLRAKPRHTAIIWTATALTLAILFLLTDKPVAMPHRTYLERVATMLVLVLGFGRCMFVGIFSSSLRESLYTSGVKLKEAYRRIEELAELDELTGSFNRRCIMRLLDDEVSRAQRSGASCSVALIDLDWFKQINDTFGHPTGDEVLRTFAITMFANIRGIDKFGRYGGEEFLLILPDTTDEAAARILDRLREIIAGLDWSAFSPGMAVTISAGVAMLNRDETPDAILARADSALYAAKERGRNRIARA
jgi:diguanylate cyclase (GGDEF)-like protein